MGSTVEVDSDVARSIESVIEGVNLEHRLGAVGLYVKLVLVSLFWGGTFIAGRVATRTMDPITIAFFRFMVASIFLAAFLTTRERNWTKPTRRQWLLIIAASLTGIVSYNLFFFNGLKIIAANRASLIVALNPVVIMLAAGLLGMEKITGQRAVGILIALFGVSIVLTNGNYSDLGSSVGSGELFILGCVGSWVIYTIIGRVLVQELSPLVVTTHASIAGSLGLLIPAGLQMRTNIGFTPGAILAVIFLGIFGTGVAFVWYYEGVQKLGPTRAGIFINLVPGWGVLLAAIVLGETVVLTSLLGGVVIVLGVLLTNQRPRSNVSSRN